MLHVGCRVSTIVYRISHVECWMLLMLTWLQTRGYQQQTNRGRGRGRGRWRMEAIPFSWLCQMEGYSLAIWGRRLQLLIIIVATKPNVKASIKTYAHTHTDAYTPTRIQRQSCDINSTCVISFNFIQLDWSSHCPMTPLPPPLLHRLSHRSHAVLVLLLQHATRQRFPQHLLVFPLTFRSLLVRSIRLDVFLMIYTRLNLYSLMDFAARCDTMRCHAMRCIQYYQLRDAANNSAVPCRCK